jgi:hypothetical protein
MNQRREITGLLCRSCSRLAFWAKSKSSYRSLRTGSLHTRASRIGHSQYVLVRGFRWPRLLRFARVQENGSDPSVFRSRSRSSTWPDISAAGFSVWPLLSGSSYAPCSMVWAMPLAAMMGRSRIDIKEGLASLPHAPRAGEQCVRHVLSAAGPEVLCIGPTTSTRFPVSCQIHGAPGTL